MEEHRGAISPRRIFGTNARNRRGLSTRIPCSVLCVTPALRSLGPNTVTLIAYPAPPLCLRSEANEKSDENKSLRGVTGLQQRQHRRYLIGVSRPSLAVETDECAALADGLL